MDFFIFLVIAIIIVVGSKIKKSIEEEAARTSKRAEQMKGKQAGLTGGVEPPQTRASVPGGSSSLQNLLAALAEQAQVQVEVRQEKRSAPPPLPPRMVQQDAGEGARLNLVDKSGFSMPAVELSRPAVAMQSAAEMKEADKPRKKRVREVPQAAMIDPVAVPAEIHASEAPIPVAPSASTEFLERLEGKTPWQSAFILQQVLGRPRYMQPIEDEQYR